MESLANQNIMRACQAMGPALLVGKFIFAYLLLHFDAAAFDFWTWEHQHPLRIAMLE